MPEDCKIHETQSHILRLLPSSYIIIVIIIIVMIFTVEHRFFDFKEKFHPKWNWNNDPAFMPQCS